MKALTIAGIAARSLSKLGEAAGAAGAAGGLIAAVAAVGILSSKFAGFLDKGHTIADVLGKAAASASTFQNALNQTNGVVDESVRRSTAMSLQQSGLADSFAKSGVSLSTLTDLVTGSDAAWQQQASSWAASGQVGLTLVTSLGKTREQFKKAVTDAQALDSATTSLTNTTQQYTAEQIAAAQALGMTVPAYVAATGAATSNAAATKAATQQMVVQNDAAGLLKQALDSLAGKQLSISEAETALGESIQNVTTVLKANANTININTAAGTNNRKAIEGAIEALRNKQQADVAGGRTQAQASAEYNKGRDALLKAVAATDGATSSTYKYAAANSAAIPQVADVATKVANLRSQISKIQSKNVHITQQGAVDARNEVQRLRDAIAALQGKTVTLVFDQVIHGSAPGQLNAGKLVQGATGGLIDGAGTGTSDSNIMRVSKGEFIMPADVTAAMLPTLQAMRSSSATTPSLSGMRAGGLQNAGDGGDTITIVQYISGTVVTENELWNKGIAEIDKRRRRLGQPGIVSSPGAPMRGVTLGSEIG
jgi:hypothetical protein